MGGGIYLLGWAPQGVVCYGITTYHPSYLDRGLLWCFNRGVGLATAFLRGKERKRAFAKILPHHGDELKQVGQKQVG